jgi:hypothetical protein
MDFGGGALSGIAAAWFVLSAVVASDRGWSAVREIPRAARILPELPPWIDVVDGKGIGLLVSAASLAAFAYGGTLAHRRWKVFVKSRCGWTDRDIENFLKGLPDW